MKVNVIAFATVSDLLGRQNVEVTLPDGSRLSDLRRELIARQPDLEAIWSRLAIAISGELVNGDHELVDGTEIALLPPVSGGSSPALAACREPLAILVDQPIDLTAVERGVAEAACGAVLLFLGTVRNHHAGRVVSRLTYSAYRPMAVTRIHRIVTELEESDPTLRVAIVHRLGEVPIGEPSVVIAVASPHRQAAYEASRTALERLKREVPIWKREHYGDGSSAWREEEPLVQRVGNSGPGR